MMTFSATGRRLSRSCGEPIKILGCVNCGKSSRFDHGHISSDSDDGNYYCNYCYENLVIPARCSDVWGEILVGEREGA